MYASDQVREPHLTAKGQATRLRIVAAAAELIAEQGVATTTLDDVRVVAGVSGSQVYHYFSDKQALVRAVIDFQSEKVLQGQRPYLTRLDTLAGLRAWRDMIIAYQVAADFRGGCPIGSLGAEVAETDDRARLRVAAAFVRWEEDIKAGLWAMHARGELDPDADPEALALALLSALQGGLLLAQIQRRAAPLEAALDMALNRIAVLAHPSA